MKKLLLLAALVTVLLSPFSSHAGPSSYVYVGEIFLFAGSDCPENTLKADGRSLSIGEHNSLYSILGTKYGGDGMSTFALPNITINADTPNDKGEKVAILTCIAIEGDFPQIPPTR